MSKSTPMMAQYQAIKAQNPDALLFFRLGDFYELFGDDAAEASRLLGLTLTARTSGEGRAIRVPMAGVPYHAAPNYIQKLLRAGRKVAICEQMEDPKKAKGMVRRELVRVVTPGTALEDGYLDSKSNNYVASLYEGKSGKGLAWADLATGEFFASELSENAGELEAELARLRPSELLLAQPLNLELSGMVCTYADTWSFEPSEAARLLKAHFGVLTLEAFGFAEESPAYPAAGALLAYFKKTQKSPLAHLTSLRKHEAASGLQMDASTRRHLEISENSEDGGRQGSLLMVLDRCKTAPGARLLKRWLHEPLAALEAIAARHDAVEELMKSLELRSRLQEALAQTPDIERALGRIGCLAAGARDLLAIRQALRQVPEFKACLGGLKPSLFSAWAGQEAFSPLLAELEKALVDDPPLSIKEGGMFKPGFDPELDRLVADSHGARDQVLQIQEKERARSGNPKLKVQFNSIFGFYIEVSKAQAGAVPADFERKQTLVGAERFTTPELKVIEERVLSADEKRKELEIILFEKLREKISFESGPLLALASRLAGLDALLSFAVASLELTYVRPEMSAEPSLDLEGSRHPVVEFLQRQAGESFTPNDCRLDAAGQQIMLLTGPNMAGKSTYMRQVALASLMAQAGCFVPASRARLGLVDRLFTRIGASDRLSRGMSTFLVEMTETARILRLATRQSLVVLDEIGRGTSTYDGVSIAWSVAEFLHESPALGCRTLFATHYFELTDLADKFPRIRNWQVMVKERQGKILFLHQVQPGCSEHSYGIAVARLAGVPEAVLKRAKEVLAGLERGHEGGAQAPQMDLFKAAPEAGAEILEALASLDPDSLPPREALALLAQWQEMLRKKGVPA